MNDETLDAIERKLLDAKAQLEETLHGREFLNRPEVSRALEAASNLAEPNTLEEYKAAYFEMTELALELDEAARDLINSAELNRDENSYTVSAHALEKLRAARP